MALSAAAGAWALRRLDIDPAHPVDGLLFSSAVGPGVWALAFLVLGFAGVLTPWVLLASAVAGCVVVRKEIAELPLRLKAVGRFLGEAGEAGWLQRTALLVTGGVGLAMLLHGVAPPTDWDSLMYHLEIPLQWLDAGRIFLPEGNLHAAYTGLFHFLYLPFLALGADGGPALLSVAFALLLGLAVLRAGELLFDGRTGALSLLLLWGTTGMLLVAITPRVDTTLAYYLFLGQAAVAAALVQQEEARRGHLLRAAVVLGLAAGIKYHALAFTTALAPVGIWALLSGRFGPSGEAGRSFGEDDGEVDRGGRTADRPWAVFGMATALFLVGVAPWLVKNVALLGEPLYPFFSERMLQPWLADLYGTRAVPASVADGAFGALGQAREPLDLVSLFTAPERLTVEQEGVHFNLSWILLLLPFAVFHLRKRAVWALAGPALLYVGGVAAASSTTNLRYLLPAIPPLILVSAVVLTTSVGALLGDRDEASRGAMNGAGSGVGRTGLRSLLLISVALATLVPTVRSGWEWTAKAPVLDHAVGAVSRQAYLQEGYAFYAGVVGLVNGQVPPEGRLLLFWEARSFHLASEVLPDNELSNWPLLRPYVEGTGSCLEETGVTHLLASPAAASYYQQRGADATRMGVEAFLAFAERCFDPVVVGQGLALYRVRGAP